MSESKPTVHSGRRQLLLIAAVFLLPVVIAIALGLAGWSPGTSGHGKPIQPEPDVSDVDIVMADGGHWAWRADEPRMTLVAFSRGPCRKDCIRTLTLLRNARIAQGKHMDRVRLLYLGRLPKGKPGRILADAWARGRDVDDALGEYRPDQDGVVSAILVESNGTAFVRYPAGFDPNGFKDDLHKVLN